MKALTTNEAIKLVDSNKDISFEYIEENVAVQFNDDYEVYQGEELMAFITSFLSYMMEISRDDDLKYKLNYSIAHRTLQGRTLNLIISECRGIAYQDQPE